MNTANHFDTLIARIKSTVQAHELEEEGVFCRWLWQDSEGQRDLGINPYGCADAVNILYTLCALPKNQEKRSALAQQLQRLQNPETGLFYESTHHPIHTTAHCIAALELLDAAPLYPLHALKPLLEKDALYDFLDRLDWLKNPWPQSHQSAGLYAALKLSGMSTPEWESWYFEWLWNEADPQTGLWRKGFVTAGQAPMYHHMGGSFHLLFNHEYAKRPLRYPDKLIDTCLALYTQGQVPENFGRQLNFIEMDWIYCLSRASRQNPHRFWECREVLLHFADSYIEYLLALHPESDDGWNDLHMLFGAVCALAELQQTLYGHFPSQYPLRLVLDRRPFI